ncbi:hypothetical protein [Paludibacterium purpuratum]|uniref:hypothetical protein n=1 Tax=Paludibacterium purpuratum TaxID=1144873 RepID=UPI00141506F8|nr:hypothetical protein [Paludibacterium purpuratum]
MLLLCLGTVGSVAKAAYAPTDGIRLFASAGLRFDDNVLLLGPGQSVPLGYGDKGRGDWIRSAGMGWHAETRHSRQTWRIDGQFNRNQYSDYRNFNYSSWQHDLGWDWAVGEQWSGLLNLSDRNDRVDAGYAPGVAQDEVRDRTLRVRALWAPNAWLGLDGESGLTRERHSAQTNYDDDLRSATFGASWSTPRGSVFGVHVEQRRVNPVADPAAGAGSDAYRLRYLRFDLVWPLSAKSQLSGRAGRVGASVAGEAAVSRGIGALAWRWLASGKVAISLGIERDFDDPGRSRTPTIHRNRYLRLSDTISEKTSMNVEWRDEKRQYDATPIGCERTRMLRVSLVFRPDRAVEITPYVSRAVRSSQSDVDSYVDNQLGATVRLYF